MYFLIHFKDFFIEIKNLLYPYVKCITVKCFVLFHVFHFNNRAKNSIYFKSFNFFFCFVTVIIIKKVTMLRKKEGGVHRKYTIVFK